MRIVKLTAESKKGLLEDLLQRSPNHYGQYESAVAEIIETVKKAATRRSFPIQRSLTTAKWMQPISA